MTPQIRLTAARNAGKHVRVTLADGRVLTGVPQRTADQDLVRVGTALFDTDDVVEVTPA